jgi:hypothetical protein
MYATNEGDSVRQRGWKRREYALIAIIGALYVVLIGRYNAFDIDSSWFPSFSYSYWVEHIETDTFMRGTFPSGMGGVVAFGKLAAIAQGALLSVFGWSLPAVTLISAGFVLVSLVFFADTCRRLGYSTNFTLCFIALLGFTEPFLAAAERARYEFLPVFLLSLALWLATRRNVVLAMFVAALAAEVEPAALVIAFAVGTFLLWLNTQVRTRQLFVRMLLGVAGAGTVFFLLHPHFVSIFRSANSRAVNKGYIPVPGGFVAAYYYAYPRHLPELAVLLVALVVCAVQKRHLLVEWPALCITVVLGLAMLLRWPNVAYFAFIAPFIWFFVLQVFYTDRRRNCILAAILLFTLPQYIHRYKLWSPQLIRAFSLGEQKELQAAIGRAAARIGKEPEELNIVGDYALWFAHPHLFVNLNQEIVNPEMLRSADLLLCLDQPMNPNAVTTQEVLCSGVGAVDYKEAETITLHDRTLQLLLPIRKQ